MRTLKNNLKQEDINSKEFTRIVKDYKHRDLVKILLYFAEDCIHLTDSQEAKKCIELVNDWLKDETSVTKEEMREAVRKVDLIEKNDFDACMVAADAGYIVHFSSYDYITFIVNSTAACAVNVFPPKQKKSKFKEYKEYARLFAYEDLDFPYKDISKTFNLDNPTDLNIFLDFLTDNYPEALIYSREEFMNGKLCKEYLKIIYQ